MNAPLTPKIEELINERLRRGSYKNRTEVIEDAFEALTERENFQAIRSELDHADEQLAGGEYTQYDERTIQQIAKGVEVRGRTRLAKERKSSTR